MCSICLRNNPFDTIDRFAKRFASRRVTELQARAKLIKVVIDSLSKTDRRCDIGEATIDRLKEEQYKISRQL